MKIKELIVKHRNALEMCVDVIEKQNVRKSVVNNFKIMLLMEESFIRELECVSDSDCPICGGKTLQICYDCTDKLCQPFKPKGN